MDSLVTPVVESLSVEELRKYRKQVTTKDYYQVGMTRLLSKYAFGVLYRCLGVLGVPIESVFGVWSYFSKVIQYSQLFLYKLSFGFYGKLMSPVQFKNSRIAKYISQNYFVIKYWHLWLAYILPVALTYNLSMRLKDRYNKVLQRQLKLQAQLKDASSYQEWIEYAKQIEDIQKKRKTHIERNKYYDQTLVLQKIQELQDLKKERDIQRLLFWARNDLWRDFANINSWEIFHNRNTVPKPIHGYMDAVMKLLDKIADYHGPQISQGDKLHYFQNVRHAYGRSALMLSGGGALGIFHLGVVKVLLQNKLLPRIIAGSSVGAIVAALVATHTDDELKESFEAENIKQLNMGFFNNQSMRSIIKHYLTQGALQDMEHFKETLKHHYNNYTFQEAYEKTGRVLNIVVTSVGAKEPARLFNHLTTPSVVIWSAVAASSAFPGLFKPTDIVAKNTYGEFTSMSGQTTTRKYQDGSLKEDLPFQGLAEIFNVNNFIVSQTNPHIVPLLNLKNKLSSRMGNVLETEFKMRMIQLKQFMPEWVPDYALTVFSQPWEGNITITLPSEYGNFLFGKAIINPSVSDLFAAIRQGEVKTWEKLAAIELNTQIEQKLDQCVSRISKDMSMNKLQQTQFRSAGLSGGIGGGGYTRGGHGTNINHLPSWNNLEHMGQIHNQYGSTDSLALLLGDNQPNDGKDSGKIKPLKMPTQTQQEQLLEESSQYSSPESNKGSEAMHSSKSFQERNSEPLEVNQNSLQQDERNNSQQNQVQKLKSNNSLSSENGNSKNSRSSMWQQLIPLAQTAFELQEKRQHINE